MNQQQALSKARKLIGKDALIRYDSTALTREEKDRLPYWKYLADKNEQNRVRGLLHHDRCAVGRIDPVLGMFFEVMGAGDNWKQAIEKAQSYIKRRA